jgi:hypothetical protein
MDDLYLRVLNLERALHANVQRLGTVEARLGADESLLNKVAAAAGGPAPTGSGSGQWAVTSGTIAAGSLASPGSGTVTLYGDAGLVAGQTATAYNVYGTAIAASKAVWLEPYAGKLYVITADC